MAVAGHRAVRQAVLLLSAFWKLENCCSSLAGAHSYSSHMLMLLIAVRLACEYCTVNCLML